MCYSANKSAVENATGELVPLLIFQRFQESGADARRRRNLVQRNAAHFALAPEAIAKTRFDYFFFFCWHFVDALGLNTRVATRALLGIQYRRRFGECQTWRAKSTCQPDPKWE